MQEIKKRIEVIDFFLSGRGHALFKPTTTESVCLQIRHILELIAFAGLCANKREYAAVHKNFETHWNAELLLRDLCRINPDFYPVPIIEIPSTKHGAQVELKDVAESPLGKDEFVKIYKKCGGLMHARNPFGSRTTHHYFDKSIPVWREQIVALLGVHRVKLVGDPGFWLIHMREDGDDEVHAYTFAPTPAVLTSRNRTK